MAEKLCDRIAIIKNGTLIKSGKTDEVIGDESLEDVFLELEENMFRALIKMNLRQLFSTMFQRSRKKRAVPC